tara:strand:+ start:797 stop:958 length:162 start_codon:yes stop_codon:yes gene_type:complete
MFYISKGLQLIGLLVIGMGFISHFPSLMSYKLLAMGILFFIMGWIVEKFGLSN